MAYALKEGKAGRGYRPERNSGVNLGVLETSMGPRAASWVPT